MTASDAEWLRERPEIAEPFAAELQAWMRRANRSLTGVSSDELLTAILPLLRAAIRADVVRELAGDASAIEERIFLFVSQNELVLPTPQLAFDKVLSLILRERAAAHAQGRAAGREEAAEVMNMWPVENRDYGPGEVEQLTMDARDAIRSLP